MCMPDQDSIDSTGHVVSCILLSKSIMMCKAQPNNDVITCNTLSADARVIVA